MRVSVGGWVGQSVSQSVSERVPEVRAEDEATTMVDLSCMREPTAPATKLRTDATMHVTANTNAARSISETRTSIFETRTFNI